MTDKIKCQVAKVLSPTELAIDAGEKDGVKRGMKFHVMGSVRIMNPSLRNTVLEEIDFVKARVSVLFLGQRASIVQTDQETVQTLLQQNPREKFRISDSERNMATGELESDWTEGVKTGDRVVQVTDGR